MALGLAAGCVTLGAPDVQRAVEGPTASEIYQYRFAAGYGRLPTFEEQFAWRDDLDRRVSDYLVKHPEIAVSPQARQFRVERRLAVGMTREEVTLLAGRPDSATTERAAMEAGAKQFWPQVSERAKEMWAYPNGWRFYFDGDRLVDITVAGKPPIE